LYGSTLTLLYLGVIVSAVAYFKNWYNPLSITARSLFVSALLAGIFVAYLSGGVVGKTYVPFAVLAILCQFWHPRRPSRLVQWMAALGVISLGESVAATTLLI